ncbi:4'-phosphopantetheinyl transferase family protein [Pseudoalteromonas tunicata]|uniref:4-phosphopantetheinyl transferase n=1 Tax=Pseudoalteromonas tunicata D2 TaxID=87626 RepID=A4CDP0_9GAMM|nr:4'-phosphopantetheinyl transferase superfamily protein [Pseudoalteromonas tunicata]ATC96427.1 4'-phosphopantetheinyl transferase [Pseudoalteromonas tunicata]AXT31914.1 hypothetical protein D1819_14535 [Pseudoalteromonas tunicata]EAR27082.1 4-phosphopantetheinyl transferase [Pseudoalteromonas tunicata D2]MDP4982250.1 4'-phosphopantetheinyl transferase superfamily protein [Pseudoalteromonas tunicata]MDP5212327.1 4'-phosphopantetheinyl transferase superfamily protein [Pseudoalteromonas tunicat
MNNTLSLNKNQVDVWQAFPMQLQDPSTLAQLQSLVTVEEHQTILQCKRPLERHTKLVTRALARYALAKYLTVDPLEIVFKKSLHGKPSIASPECELSFNLSHSADFVMCAITKQAQIGIDVEKIRYKPSLLKMGETVFNQQELTDIASFTGPAQHRRFFDYWTLKESFVKATGAGLTTPLQSITCQPGHIKAQLQLATEFIDRDKHWQCYLWPISQQHRLAITLDKQHPEPTDIRCFHFFPATSNTLFDVAPSEPLPLSA